MRERAKDPERHARRMDAKQKIMQERIARAQKEQGVLLVLTGPGKGKSSSGFGMVARALRQLGAADGYGNSEVPMLVLNVIHPLVPDEIAEFMSDKDSVLVVEEGNTL